MTSEPLERDLHAGPMPDGAWALDDLARRAQRRVEICRRRA